MTKARTLADFNTTNIDPALLDDTGTIPSALLAGVGGGGLEEADQWRITSEFTGAANPPTNWERNDTFSDKVGTGMTHSNGYFSFPSTGIYSIDFQRVGYCPNKAANIHTIIKFTNNNSSYTTIAQGLSSTQPNSQDPSNNDHYICRTGATVDVTDITQNKVYFGFSHYGSVSGLNSSGSTNANYCYVNFIKLGET